MNSVVVMNIVNAAIAACVAVIAIDRIKVPGAKGLMACGLFMAMGSIFYAAELTASTLSIKLLYADLQFIPIMLLPVAWFLTITHACAVTDGRRQLHLFLFVIPVFTWSMILTNPLHHLYRGGSTLCIRDGITMVDYCWGPWYYAVILPFASLLPIAGLGVLLHRASKKSLTLVQRQMNRLMTIGTILPGIAYIITASAALPANFFNLSTLALTAATVLLAFGLFRYRFLDVVPIGRSTLIDRMTDLWIVLDNYLAVVDCNDVVRTHFSVRSKNEFPVLDHLFTMHEGLREHIISPQTDHLTLSMVDQNDCMQHYDLTVTILYSPTGTSSGRLLVLRNITHEKTIIEELNALKDDLKNQVESRTARLVEAEKRASVGVLAAGIAHEIGNPLHFMLINTRVLERGWNAIVPLINTKNFEKHEIGTVNAEEFIHEIPDLLSELGDGCRRIEQIVTDIKEFACPSDELFSPVELNTVAERALRISRAYIKSHTDNFEFCSYKTPVEIIGNTHQLEQVLINLLQNSCRALTSKNQMIRIEIAAEPVPTIRVVDEGCGMSPQVLACIGDPFFTTRRTSGGTGLGISVAHRIVNSHGGFMRFESCENEGTIVSIEFRKSQDNRCNA